MMSIWDNIYFWSNDWLHHNRLCFEMIHLKVDVEVSKIVGCVSFRFILDVGIMVVKIAENCQRHMHVWTFYSITHSAIFYLNRDFIVIFDVHRVYDRR